MCVPALESPPAMTARIPSQPARIGRAATDFEALLIEQMLKSARESAQVDSGDSDGAERNSAVMELGEQQFAQSLANSGGFGIARMVVAGLSKDANR
jgi:Rod binding domain-containing protein